MEPDRTGQSRTVQYSNVQYRTGQDRTERDGAGQDNWNCMSGYLHNVRHEVSKCIASKAGI